MNAAEPQVSSRDWASRPPSPRFLGAMDPPPESVIQILGHLTGWLLREFVSARHAGAYSRRLVRERRLAARWQRLGVSSAVASSISTTRR